MLLDKSDDAKVKILVTGFGSFADVDNNPSWLVAQRLARLPAQDSVQIFTYPKPITVAYQSVRNLIPRLLFASDPSPDVPNTSHFDLVIHLGVAGDREYYSLETRARRGLYTKHDIWNENLENDKHWQDTDTPAVLQPSFDVVGLCNLMRNTVPYDIRPSDEAGLFLCEFIYFTSLSEFWRRRLPLPVIFCHVPSGNEDQDIAKGADVVLALITNLVNGADMNERKRDG